MKTLISLCASSNRSLTSSHCVSQASCINSSGEHGGFLVVEASRHSVDGQNSKGANHVDATEPDSTFELGLRDDGVSADVSERQHVPSIAARALALIVATRPDANGRWTVELRSIEAVDFYLRAAS
jgi:hypothetical protein